ncbi:SdpI family protein [Usitatibacter rugosus]|uniref:SdpI family protein n=1 Tax=Usitatibacter rugosus TaxID=2732067 RepID=UPI003CCCA943
MGVVSSRSTRSLGVIEYLVNAPISLLVPCGIILVASIPLMLGLVPPNRLYGFRTRETLGNRDLWFRANRFAGFALFVAAGASSIVFLVQPEYASGRSLAGLLVLLLPLVTAIAACFVYLQRLRSGGPR